MKRYHVTMKFLVGRRLITIASTETAAHPFEARTMLCLALEPLTQGKEPLETKITQLPGDAPARGMQAQSKPFSATHCNCGCAEELGDRCLAIIGGVPYLAGHEVEKLSAATHVDPNAHGARAEGETTLLPPSGDHRPSARAFDKDGAR